MANRISSREVRLAKIMIDGRDLFVAMGAFRTAAQKREKPVKPSGDTDNPYFEVVEMLRKLATTENVPIVVIGGVAGVYHGYERTTDDMDIVVSPGDYERFIRNCYAYGFILDMKHTGLGAHIYYKGLKIEVLKGGTMTGAKEGLREIPSPAEMGVTHGLEFVPLERWFQLKIASGRDKDIGDITELIKRLKPEKYEDIEAYLHDFNPKYAEKFRNRVQRAQEEKQQEYIFSGG